MPVEAEVEVEVEAKIETYRLGDDLARKTLALEAR
jgi:hypothetical protein